MPRKRKTPVNKKQKEIDDLHRKELMRILYNVQLSEAYHKKYTKELQDLYEQMEHNNFTSTFILCLQQLMQKDFNQYTNVGLKFMAQFVTSFQAEDMHPLFDSMFQWIFNTVSLTASVRFRLCEFVNMMLSALPDDGDIEEYHCDEILSYMFDRLKDTSPQVRVQAIKALCRLQIQDDPDDDVTKIFLFHLECDPSPLVRQAVLSSIARSVHTIPFIMKRLLDVDVRVRRSVLAHMSNFSMKKYTIEQRLTLLEHGLNDSSETVQSIAINILLPQWLAYCDNNFINFLSNLKLDSNEAGMDRFRTIARMSLLVMFRSHDPDNLINVLPLIDTDNDENTNHQLCIEMDKLTPELIEFWFALIAFFQSDDSKSEYLEKILPDPTTYCQYLATISRQAKTSTNISKWILPTLYEILHVFDLGDETGRQSVQNAVVNLLTNSSCDENHIKSLIKISEKLIPKTSDRLQFYVDIVKNIINPADVDTNNLNTTSKMDPNTEVEVASLKMKLFELKEVETECLEVKDYDKLTSIREEICLCNEQITFLITPFLPCASTISTMKRTTTESILKALQLIFYGLCSKTVKQLIPSMFQLYKDVIRVRVESKNMIVRNWALKCTATCSLLYSQLANDAYSTCCKQLFCHEVACIWITSIGAMFQLINRYGFERFSDDNQIQNSVQAETSLLNETLMSCKSLNDIHDMARIDREYVSAGDMLLLFAQYLDSIHDADITCELVDGFCMLILSGRLFDEKIMSKLIVMFYNTNTDTKAIHILSIFFETIIQRKKQKYLQLSLFDTLSTITSGDESLMDIQPRLILQFFIHSTLKMKDSEGMNLHNDIATTLLSWMDLHSSDQKSLNFIAKEMLLLKVSDDREIRMNLMNLVSPLLKRPLNKETVKNLNLFKQRMELIGIEPLQFSSINPANGADEDGSNFSNENTDAEIDTEINGNSNVNSKNNNVENEVNESNKQIKQVVEPNEQEGSSECKSATTKGPSKNKSTTKVSVSSSGKRMPLYPLEPVQDNKRVCDISFRK